MKQLSGSHEPALEAALLGPSVQLPLHLPAAVIMCSRMRSDITGGEQGAFWQKKIGPSRLPVYLCETGVGDRCRAFW
jgi:hypothetical protein